MADKKISDGTLRDSDAWADSDVIELEKPGTATQFKATLGDISGRGVEKSSDPADPGEGRYVIWQSDGTDSGGDGDILLKVTAAGATKFVTLFNFSAIP